jgi:hypothetical protein
MEPAGETMLGDESHRIARADVEYEFMQIRIDGNAIVFVARPSGQPEHTFTRVGGGAHEAIFENLQHDFPQRVIYRLQPDGVLMGRIEVTERSRGRAVDCPMRRVPCP